MANHIAAAALREEADRLEHGVEYNANEAMRLSREDQAENNRLINRVRELRDRADVYAGGLADAR